MNRFSDSGFVFLTTPVCSLVYEHWHPEIFDTQNEGRGRGTSLSFQHRSSRGQEVMRGLLETQEWDDLISDASTG